jgi:hypothetical protein
LVKVRTYIGPHIGSSGAVVAHDARFISDGLSSSLSSGHVVLLYMGGDGSLSDVAGDVCVGSVSFFVVVIEGWDWDSW